jgi:transposase-like protein
VTGLHFPWVPCPECDGENVYDVGADNAPTFSFECRDCGADWEATGFGMSFGSTVVEGHEREA